ncbi:MAG TPA: UvrD-helicase domain-containing protein [Solirubrobacterales bacterium]
MTGARELTPEQEAAVATDRSEALVEAGAGTGKTGVMVERYCRLVCEQGLDPDEILAFTFTDKAAAELRERIRSALLQRSLAGSGRAGELLAGFGGAWVTTIHGFCNRLLAGHPVAARIDPRFRVLDAPEAERIAAEAFEEALRAFLEGGDAQRERTLASYELAGLRSIVIEVHEELRSRGHPRPMLPEPAAGDAAAAVRRAAEAAAAAVEDPKLRGPAREIAERAAQELAGTGATLPDLDLVSALRTKNGGEPLNAYRDAIEAACARVAEAGEGGLVYRDIGELLVEFSARFRRAKERRSGVDFEDLQLLAVDLLERDEIGAEYQRRFSHILLDEFQDTNRLQLRLVEALRGPATRLMVVGDELQSIYGFRHADLDVFRERRRAAEERPEAEAMALSGNFRARPELIGAVNEIGRALFGDAYRPLRVGAEPAPEENSGGGPAVEMLLTADGGRWKKDRSLDLRPATDATTPRDQLAEARYLAARLRQLVDGGVERGGIVVLLRAFTHLDAYEDSLERAGLRPYTVGGQGYWSHQQVGDVCALLATIANPLDDERLFGALASPACGAAPDTLWLLRRAAGGGMHVWPVLERVAGIGDHDPREPERLEQIPPEERELLRDFTERIAGLRSRGPRLGLSDLIDAAVTETGYDLATLSRPAGEARFANVRKLMRIAAEFEAREGRDLRGLLEYLAIRADADADAGAATAAEAHDGVRIMTVHGAKGLEFDVVAVPMLGRRLLAGRLPVLAVGRGEDPDVGLQLRRLGAPSVNLFHYRELCDDLQQRGAEEELRLFHVAATRARRRLILSGVVEPKAKQLRPGTPVIERIVEALDIDRAADSTLSVPGPPAREGLAATFRPSEIAVRVNLPTAEQARLLALTAAAPGSSAEPPEGPAPLLERRPPVVPRRPLSYTAISAFGECPYRFYMERVLGIGGRAGGGSHATPPDADDGSRPGSRREQASARGAAVHTLLEWSQANGWAEPDPDLAGAHAVAAGLDPEEGPELIAPIRAWLGSELFRDRVVAEGSAVRAEVPLLLGVSGSVLRGSIDLLIEGEGAAPLVIDYKTDRLAGSTPASHAGRYEIQRSIYALAAAEALGASEVEVAYVFLERPQDPVLTRLDRDAIEAGRARIAAEVERITTGQFPTAPAQTRSWDLCRGCPALGGLCSGPRGAAPE